MRFGFLQHYWILTEFLMKCISYFVVIQKLITAESVNLQYFVVLYSFYTTQNILKRYELFRAFF